jgi:hypothetical protein
MLIVTTFVNLLSSTVLFPPALVWFADDSEIGFQYGDSTIPSSGIAAVNDPYVKYPVIPPKTSMTGKAIIPGLAMTNTGYCFTLINSLTINAYILD